MLRPLHCLALSATLAASLALPARAAEEDIKLPSGIDYSRMKLLESKGENRLLKVYVNMVGIGDSKAEVQLLVPKRVGESIGTHAQMNRRFMDTIRSTGRFEVYDDSTTGMRDKSDIVVDGMVVAAIQDIEDLTAIRKSVTTLRLSIQVKDTASGKLMQARTITGIYGSEPGEGTRVQSDKDLKTADTQTSLANDFERALREALENAAAYIERTYRPIGRVRAAEDKEVVINGGSNHGLRENDRLVIFRASFVTEGGREVPGIMKPVAVVECGSVSPDDSQCTVLKQKDEIKPGYFGLVTESSLKLREQ